MVSGVSYNHSSHRGRVVMLSDVFFWEEVQSESCWDVAVTAAGVEGLVF